MKEIVALDEFLSTKIHQWDVFMASVFLAGGITSCPDWQSDMVKKLSDTNLTLLNPRRTTFDITDPVQSELQIAWEHAHLKKAMAILFWFPKETLCPITLYELGYWAADRHKRLFVGTDPEYQRKIDVVTQLRLERPGIQVVHSLDELAQQVIAEFTLG